MEGHTRVQWSTINAIKKYTNEEIVLRGWISHRVSNTSTLFFVLCNLDGDQSVCCTISACNKELKLFAKEWGKNSIVNIQGSIAFKKKHTR